MKYVMTVLVVVALAACSESADVTTTVADTTPATTTSGPATTEPAPTTTVPATTAAPTPDPVSFDIPVGSDGVTYDASGSPATGPSSFAVLDDGSVVVADTIAVKRGEPRLLVYDAAGGLSDIYDLAAYQVDAISDIATDGDAVAVLDIRIDILLYRVHILSGDGELQSTFEIPLGYRFEDGLTGLAWDDDGVLLEFEFGSRYARIGPEGVTPVDRPSYRGSLVTVTPGEGRQSSIVIGMDEYTVTRGTDLGGVSVIGVAPNGTSVLLVTEVDLSGEVIAVLWRVQRRSPDGDVVAEAVFDVADQFTELERAFEMGPDGKVRYLLTAEDRVSVVILDI